MSRTLNSVCRFRVFFANTEKNVTISSRLLGELSVCHSKNLVFSALYSSVLISSNSNSRSDTGLSDVVSEMNDNQVAGLDLDPLLNATICPRITYICDHPSTRRRVEGAQNTDASIFITHGLEATQAHTVDRTKASIRSFLKIFFFCFCLFFSNTEHKVKTQIAHT